MMLKVKHRELDEISRKLKNDRKEKEFIDELRCRNGNLEISCGRAIFSTEQL